MAACAMVKEGCRVAADIGGAWIQSNGCIAKCQRRIFGTGKAEVEVERDIGSLEGLQNNC
jgi:hypothetical protein